MSERKTVAVSGLNVTTMQEITLDCAKGSVVTAELSKAATNPTIYAIRCDGCVNPDLKCVNRQVEVPPKGGSASVSATLEIKCGDNN